MSFDTHFHYQANVNFELYKIFYYAASALNFSKAAEKLHVTQSAVSQAIKSLEGQLGVHLFYRQGRTIRLTFEGEMLYEHVEKAYNFIRSAENTLSSIKSLDEGTIFIGASDTISRYHLMPYIKAFHSQYTRVKIAVNNRPSPKSVALLKTGQIDIAVININPDQTYEGIDVRHFITNENIFICHPETAALINRNVKLSEINEYPVICLEEHSTTRIILEKFYEDHSLTLTPSFEFGSIEVILEAVKANMGVGFVNSTVATDDIANGRLCRIKTIERIPKTEIGIITSNNKPLSIAAQKFLAVLSKSTD
ncbi:MAG: hypothetical protein PWP51_1161 [Clostridiales bacterium]|nr:hypothetical protein [Clostridiales bacterium]